MLKIKVEKYKQQQKIELANQESEHLEKRKSYNYLGILEGDTNKQRKRK